MNQLQTSTYYMKQKNLFILPDFSISIKLIENKYDIPIEQLFQMAARINKNRSFLFVSNVLGKHIPVHPNVSLSVGILLAANYAHEQDEKILNPLISTIKKRTMHELPTYFIKEKNPIIIGFAETATALGHSFFQAFEGATYVHTTREVYQNKRPFITFEEEHSHATSHYIYANEKFFKNNREIILVDDELTTGKTNLNIIRALHERYPRKNYTIISILDWRTDAHVKMYAQLEKELDITIRSISLVRGNFELTNQPTLPKERLYENTKKSLEIREIFVNQILPKHYYEEIDGERTFIKQGRFTLNSFEQKELDAHLLEISKQLIKENVKKVLCIGTGEFMYIPMKVASLLKEEVVFQSTTRSPIFPYNKEKYGVQSKICFQSLGDSNILNYLYNIENKEYDTILLFLEKNYSNKQLQPMIKQLSKIGAKKLIKLIF